MNKVTLTFVLCLALIGGLLAYWQWFTPTPTSEAETALAIGDEPNPREGTTTVETNTDANPDSEKALPKEAGPNISETDQQLLAMGYTREQLQEKRRLLALEKAADQRFEEAVRVDRLSADQVRPEVKQLMQTLNLEPVLDRQDVQEGYVGGLKIVELLDSNPFAIAGFKTGDTLTAINGQPLQDPAQIAYLFTTLQQRFEVCAERDGHRYCEMVELAKS